MGALEIYQKLPPPVQQAVMAGYSFKLSRARYGRVFRETLEFFERSELWTPEEARRYQSERLLTLLREAKAHTAYYRESLASFSDKTLREIASDLDMARLPLVPKSVVKARTLISSAANTEPFSNRKPVAQLAPQWKSNMTTGRCKSAGP